MLPEKAKMCCFRCANRMELGTVPLHGVVWTCEHCRILVPVQRMADCTRAEWEAMTAKEATQ
jgi:late competence protein required for DNA uptake (superfamily II DNA/RNA helicase)